MEFAPVKVGRPSKNASGGDWVDTGLVPPSYFVAAAMDLTVMSSAKRDRKLITDLAPECS